MPHRGAVLLLPPSVLKPDKAEFHRPRPPALVVPVWRELLADLTTPVAAFARLAGDGPGFLLESVEHGERWGRFSFVGRNPQATPRGPRLAVEVEGDLGAEVPRDSGALAALDALLASYQSPHLPELPAAARRRHRLPRLRRGPGGRAPSRRSRPTTWATPTPSCRSSVSWRCSTTGASGSRSSRT